MLLNIRESRMQGAAMSAITVSISLLAHTVVLVMDLPRLICGNRGIRTEIYLLQLVGYICTTIAIMAAVHEQPMFVTACAFVGPTAAFMYVRLS